MDKIRLGNDIEMRWSIFTRDGDNKVPYNLEGRALTLSVVNRTGESEIEFFAEGNIVTGVFRGRDQRILGKHGVILRENNGENGMRTIDACDAFELVACSCEEALGSPGTIQLFHLTFDSTIGAITGTIDPILNYEAEQAEAERKANEIIRKANEQQRIDNEKQRNVNEILRNTAEEERENAEQERRVNEDLRKADEAERKTNEESRLQSESERVSSEEERLYAESIRVANENARIASEAKRAEAETARIEAEDKRIVSEKNRLSAESSRIANEDSRRANEDSRLSAEAKRVSAESKRVSAEEERQIAEEERKAKFASMVVQSTGDATDKVMSQKSVTEALKGKQNKLTAGSGISIDGDVISATLNADIIRVVDALPSVGEANLIYLVPAEQPSESDLFEEWVWTDRWERIGSAKIDLSNYATKTELAAKANIQHHHTVADITDFPELYYDATAFFTSGAYPSEKYEELLEAVKAKKTVYATIDEEGYVSYVFFMSTANSDGLSSRVLLTTIFADGSNLYTNTFVLQQSGMTSLQENITGKANKAKTLAGYGIADAYTKSELDALLKKKQDTLTAGNGISIEGNEIGVTAITESESQPDTSLWLNPSEDEETDVTYNRSQIDAMVGAKQDALQLTVKDNGNIVLSNIQGQSKEFMPATPSGDPMHYAYVAAGAEYNDTGADIVKDAPWADLADEDADKTVVHKAGYWYLNGLGDITNEQMRVIFIETNNFMEDISQSAQARYCYLISRTHMNPPMYHITTGRLRVDYVDFVRSSKNLESIIFPVYKPSIDYCFRPRKITTAFSYCPNLKYIYGIINLCDCIEQNNAFYQSPNIRICQLNKLRLNLNIDNLGSISSKSILYMIQNEAATSAITITLHADAYARAMANADILAALEAHPNVSLASA